MTGNFAIKEKPTTAVSISCNGANQHKKLLYEIQFILDEGIIYFLHGSFFPSNTKYNCSDLLYFEATNQAPVMLALKMRFSLEDTVGVSTCGIIAGVDNVKEECIQNLKLKAADEDYHPVAPKSKATASGLAYCIQPFPHLAGIHKILKNGCELIFHSLIHDFNKHILMSHISLTTPCYLVPKGLSSNSFNKVNEISVPDSDKEDNCKTYHFGNGEYRSGGSSVGVKSQKYKPDANPDVNRSSSSSGNYVPNHGLMSAFKSPIIDSFSNSVSGLPFPPTDLTPSSYCKAPLKFSLRE
ncbi:hypothetical protein DFH28DRAFT_1082648 [Melampsora americana]|nr:hypothetical protein DFH28DRAFT_1082648 [Melampsora americana]